jgi:hypothetical protein
MKPIKLLTFLFACFWGFEQINAQVSADFTSFQDSCSLGYGFYPNGNLTPNDICIWNFGNGQTFTSQGTQGVNAFYNNPGVYYVSLNVQSGGQTVSNTDTITVLDYISSLFFATQGGGGCAMPQNYSFIGTSNNPNNPIVFWDWYINGAPVGNNSTVNYQFTQPGVYQVALSGYNQSGCWSEWIETITVGAGNNTTAFTSSTPISSCSANCDGSITASATGSVGPYTFVLTPGNVTLTGNQVTFDNLCAGAYSIYIYDQNQCLTVLNETVSSPSNLIVDGVLTATNACQTTFCNASLETVVSGGVAPYQYSLNNGLTYQASNVFDSLCAGTYIVQVQDANACLGYYTFVVNTGVSLGAQSSTYFQGCDSTQGGNGSIIQVYPYGGAAPYTINWSNGSTDYTVFNLSPGPISVIITDANGCTYSETFIVPNNDCFTISGNVYVDYNGNCLVDGNDHPIFCWVDLTASAGGPWLWIYDYTDANGAYQITAPSGTYFFDVNGYNVGNYTLNCPAANYSVTVDATNPNAVVNFFLSPPPPSQDLRISMNSPYTFTPGFPTYTNVTYCNDGTIPMSGNVVVQYDPALVWYQTGTTPSGNSIYSQSVPTFHDVANHTLTYNFAGLMPGQCQYLDIDYETPIGTGLIPGFPIAITATVNPISGDVTPANNVTVMNKVITSSWDPNDKAVSPEGDITVDDNDHSYFIRFQNEGNGYATMVVVRDELDANLDLKTLRGVYASHDYILTVENDNELVFTFNNIQLAPLSVDEAASQGSVGFTVSQLEDLPIGTVIENTAAIYFDFNPAIITNTVENEIVEKVTGITNIAIENALSVYPNPSTSVFNVGLEANYNITAAKVYDLLGNTILELVDVNSQLLQVNLQNAVAGVYFLEITTAEGKAVKKLVKESK